MRLMPFVLISILAALALPGAGSLPALAGKRMVPCNFPNGWNPTDFHRQTMNVTPDIHHYCEVDGRGRTVDKAGRPTT